MENLRQPSELIKTTATGGNCALTPQEPRHFAAPTACRASWRPDSNGSAGPLYPTQGTSIARPNRL